VQDRFRYSRVSERKNLLQSMFCTHVFVLSSGALAEPCIAAGQNRL
jgi:hypothetical protein